VSLDPRQEQAAAELPGPNAPGDQHLDAGFLVAEIGVGVGQNLADLGLVVMGLVVVDDSLQHGAPGRCQLMVVAISLAF
jgi:hypothetical protein